MSKNSIGKGTEAKKKRGGFETILTWKYKQAILNLKESGAGTRNKKP